MNEVLECPVCFEAYDYDAHRPLLLPVCGHTICSSCLSSGCISSCPEDRTPIGDYAVLPTNILALRSIEAHARTQSLDVHDVIPGVDSDVKLMRSQDVQLLEKVGEGGSGEVWRASCKHKQVITQSTSSMLHVDREAFAGMLQHSHPIMHHCVHCILSLLHPRHPRQQYGLRFHITVM
jgi:hypothetical protein